MHGMQRRGILLSPAAQPLLMGQGMEKAELDFLQSQAEFPMTTLGRCSAIPDLDIFSSVSSWNEAEDGIPAGGFSLALFAGPSGSGQQRDRALHLRQGHEWEWERQISFPRAQQSPAVPNWTLMHNTLSRKDLFLETLLLWGGFHGHAIFFHFKRRVAELKKQNKTEKSFLSPGIFATSLLYNKCTFPAGLRALLSCLGRGAIHSRFTGKGRSHTLSFHSRVVPNQEPPQDTI